MNGRSQTLGPDLVAAHRCPGAVCKIDTTAKKAKLVADLRKQGKDYRCMGLSSCAPVGATSKFVSGYPRSACSFFLT